MTDLLSPSPWTDRQDYLREHPPLSHSAALARIAELEAALDTLGKYLDFDADWVACGCFPEPDQLMDAMKSARASLRNR